MNQGYGLWDMMRPQWWKLVKLPDSAGTELTSEVGNELKNQPQTETTVFPGILQHNGSENTKSMQSSDPYGYAVV